MMMCWRWGATVALLLASLYAPGAALAPSTVLVRGRAATVTRGQVVMRKGVGGKKLNFKNKQTKGRESGPVPWTAVNGVSIPQPGKIKAWALPLGAGGKEKILTCVNYASDLHVFDSSCTKCAWDMWKGDVVPTENEPRIACPLCGTTYVLSSGEPRAALKREGFQGWVGGLARTSTAAEQATTLTRYPAKISVPEGSNEPLVELDLRNLKTD
mmetsp:Transcript_59084/g.163213  ORF Transcript_59084/g.163213 Transcript_59084/m.163213 type:complete len:213 (-) Transcript_59084:296-934(-)|eukprot:CAMPEP_0119465300 /NCGR_PEP_ID=MMETSP1344-20130328/492_1 /TAXON_ID=236787 /ORGANISM="Florenciella parvula, Strain CCMP2471" /LENGTH=212 /DNA_ID=CAMNT_0007497549 /DNA_START=62 /DNA_END=700 /DNA_ORIENTATION=-